MVLKRTIDITISTIALLFLSIPLLIIAIVVKISSSGPIFFITKRVGRNNKVFLMPKFRTMHVGTPVLGTHELINHEKHITRIGSFLRRTSLDELPQLFSVIKGDLSLVGPRPSLPNEYRLNHLRKQYMVHELLPGITGWAQINGRDNLTIEQKAQFDAEYLFKRSAWFDIKIILRTIFFVLKREGIRH